ncbi:unknown [Prevotella sp. CAG:755]|nr:unknown [Prevotella sp. CAG:755]
MPRCGVPDFFVHPSGVAAATRAVTVRTGAVTEIPVTATGIPDAAAGQQVSMQRMNGPAGPIGFHAKALPLSAASKKPERGNTVFFRRA